MAVVRVGLRWLSTAYRLEYLEILAPTPPLLASAAAALVAEEKPALLLAEEI